MLTQEQVAALLKLNPLMKKYSEEIVLVRKSFFSKNLQLRTSRNPQLRAHLEAHAEFFFILSSNTITSSAQIQTYLNFFKHIVDVYELTEEKKQLCQKAFHLLSLEAPFLTFKETSWRDTLYQQNPQLPLFNDMETACLLAASEIEAWKLTVVQMNYGFSGVTFDPHLIETLFSFYKMGQDIRDWYDEVTPAIRRQHELLADLVPIGQYSSLEYFLLRLNNGHSSLKALCLQAFAENWVIKTTITPYLNLFDETIQACKQTIYTNNLTLLNKLRRMRISDQKDDKFNVNLFHKLLVYLHAHLNEFINTDPKPTTTMVTARRNQFLLFAFYFHMRCIDNFDDNLPLPELHLFCKRALLCLAQMEVADKSYLEACEYLGQYFMALGGQTCTAEKFLTAYMQTAIRFFEPCLTPAGIIDTSDFEQILELKRTCTLLADMICPSAENTLIVAQIEPDDAKIARALILSVPNSLSRPNPQPFNAPSILADLTGTKALAEKMAAHFERQAQPTFFETATTPTSSTSESTTLAKRQRVV